MAAINTFSENIILPLADRFTGQSVRRHLSFLEKSQWWSLDELRSFQEEKLRSLIHHSVTSVPYYKDLFKINNLKIDDIQKIEDLKKIPVLTKKTIIAVGLEKFISKSIPCNNLLKQSSSGSTGEPLTFYTSKEAYSFNIAANLRGWYWMGYRLGDRFLKISNSPRSYQKKLQDLVTRNQFVYFNDYNDALIRSIVNTINTYHPKILRSYPTPLSLVINFAEKEELKLPKLHAVNTTGSILYPEFREKIESIFGCQVFDSYSCEGGANVFECETHECYHSSNEYAITEILDSDGRNSTFGRVVTTDLWNYATPFIRYDTQDLIELSPKKCSCRRELLPIKRILGRDTDILVAPDGKYVTPHLISVFFKGLDGVEQFQVRQEKIDEFKIYIKINETVSGVPEEKIRSFWSENFSEDVKVSVIKTNEISLTPSGKRRYIIRSSSIEL